MRRHLERLAAGALHQRASLHELCQGALARHVVRQLHLRLAHDALRLAVDLLLVGLHSLLCLQRLAVEENKH